MLSRFLHDLKKVPTIHGRVMQEYKMYLIQERD